MERTVFIQHVLSAVGHLGDSALLGDHPLGSLLFPGKPRDERGRELGDLLRAAIEELRPTELLEANRAARRRAEYLDLRYRRGRRAASVAQELGLSDRQARRIHQEAIEALAQAVWARRQSAAGSSPGPAAAADLARESDPSTELESEIARLGATPSIEGTSLSEVLRGALGTVAPLVERHGVRVECATLPPLPLVAVDRAVLRQVVVNLLVASVDPAARRLELVVQTVGDVVEVAFTTHYRSVALGRRDDQRRHDELLGVVQRLIQLQAGTIEVRAPDPSTGVVILSLPVAQPATILLVDDNPDTLRLYRRYLSGRYRPLEAADGRRALELARQTQPRGIVLDVMLPSRDGWEILQALRHDLATERIPVVICSVLHQEELAQALGATAYLTKPISRDVLLSTLRQALGYRATSQARPEPVG